ncbi:FtsK/SpoIIIE family DNA translocase [Laceyella tengchongensis]|uniref:FtsK/SpoIIIE family DNA translocase n=1 Tax=Laceyella tengchongensis TaxID=574699 RepID=UPI0012B7FDAF|nr:DNA translocase FtsK [Laceyella tengchongensis]
MARKKKKKKQPEQLKREILFEIYGITLLALSFITMASYGAIGRNLTYLARFIVGTWDFAVPIIGIWLAVYVMVNRKWPQRWSPRMTGVLLVFLSLLAYNHYLTFHTLQTKQGIVDATWYLLLDERTSAVPQDIGSGMVGAVLYALLRFLFADTGTLIVLGALVLSGILLVADFSYVKAFKKTKGWIKKMKKKAKRSLIEWLRGYVAKQARRQKKRHKATASSRRREDAEQGVSNEPIVEPIIYDFADHAYQKEAGDDMKPKQLQLQLKTEEGSTPRQDVPAQAAGSAEPAKEEELVVRFQTHTPAEYRLPSLSLLTKFKRKHQLNQGDYQENAKILVEKLKSFGVKANVTGIHRGPAVTRYEIQPETGVKVSRIVNLADDIALALAAQDIRIEAPIPGKSAVGIEVPNSEVAKVGLRDVIESSPYQDNQSKLSIALGRDIYGEPKVDSLAKMPHLLIAGATGSGKSVCINGIVVSLLYKARPDEVKLLMIDPKMVELNVYNGIPHLLVPVVTEPRKAAVALKKVVAEMEKRYELFAKMGARDIERYNQMVTERKEDGKEPLPYIVVIVDELADLMMVAPSDVEDAICRLAQMARAAGIHLIIATQRPSVDVITGVIKANIPSRIAFAVSSQADSRTILDMGGAEKLLGRGDMLYLPTGASKPIRIQGAFVTDEEVEAVVKFVKGQQEPHYQEEMIPQGGENQAQDMTDELYPQAVQIVLESQAASASLLQRRLRVGYTRAARLIDMMEGDGLIGPYEGSKPREVLMTKEQYEQKQNSSQISKPMV